MLAAGLVLLVAAAVLWWVALRMRARVRRTSWLLSRVSAAIAEAERCRLL